METGAEEALRTSDLRDLDEAIGRKQLRILVLAVGAILAFGWVGLELQSPVVALVMTLIAILPLKFAFRRWMALESRRVDLLRGGEADGEGEA